MKTLMAAKSRPALLCSALCLLVLCGVLEWCYNQRLGGCRANLPSGVVVRPPRQVERFHSQKERTSESPETFEPTPVTKTKIDKTKEQPKPKPRTEPKEEEEYKSAIEAPPAPTKNLLYALRAKAKEQPVPDAYGGRDHQIDRLFYINMDKNRNRRDFMEGWLSHSNIPHTRVPARVGGEDDCLGKFKGKPCIGLSGLSKTILGIFDDHNMTGHTLILEDDFRFDVLDLQSHLRAVLDMIPNDWDLLRFECWDMEGKLFDRRINDQVVDIAWSHIRPMTNCYDLTKSCSWFCGGTHSMLIRGTSVPKLRNIWGEMPFNDPPDCKLSRDGDKFNLTTYCANTGIGAINYDIPGETSDIVKAPDP